MRTRIIVLSLLTTLLPSALGQFDTLLGGKASIGATSHGNLSTGVTPRSPNVLERLALEKRQFVCDAGPGGPICSATTCCAAGKRCCGNPPNGCCPSDTTCFGTNECCPSGAQTCGGSTCCTSGSSCCTSSPTGCCVGGAVCCQSKTTPCCPSGSTCCGDTCCLSGETCDQGSCINSSHIASGRVARFQFDAKKNGQLLHNMCVGMGGRNTMELNYAGKLTDREKKTRRGSSGCAAGLCQSRGTAGLSSCEEYPPVMSGTGAGTLLNLTTAVVNCIPAIQNARQGGIYGQMIANSSIAAGQTFTVSVDCDNVLKATLPPATGELTLPKSGLTTTDNVFPADASIKEAVASIVVAFGDLKAGTCTVDYKVNGGAIDGGALIVDNLGDHYAASTKTALDQGQSDSLSFSIGAGGEAMGVGLLLPSRNANDTVISWSIQCQELPPEADTSDDGSSGGGSSGGGGGGGSNGGSSGGFFGGSSRSHSGQNHLLWVLVAILSLAVLL